MPPQGTPPATRSTTAHALVVEDIRAAIDKDARAALLAPRSSTPQTSPVRSIEGPVRTLHSSPDQSGPAEGADETKSPFFKASEWYHTDNRVKPRPTLRGRSTREASWSDDSDISEFGEEPALDKVEGDDTEDTPSRGGNLPRWTGRRWSMIPEKEVLDYKARLQKEHRELRELMDSDNESDAGQAIPPLPSLAENVSEAGCSGLGDHFKHKSAPTEVHDAASIRYRHGKPVEDSSSDSEFEIQL